MRAAVAVVLVALAAVAIADAPMTPRYFRHDDKHHDVAKCETCHAVDARTHEVAVPGADGHQPCLQSGCHAKEFVSAPGGFCLGCHASRTGKPPAAYEKPAAVFRSWEAEIEHHVELDHYKHATMSRELTCKTCHRVNDAGDLALGAPGHRECASCHVTQAPVMTACAGCHRPGHRADPFAEQRKAPRYDSDTAAVISGALGSLFAQATNVRACDSLGMAHLKKIAPDKAVLPCFEHQQDQHRALECGTCHTMIADKSQWHGSSYESLEDIQMSSIIPRYAPGAAHDACRTGGCHKTDLDPAAKGACTKCHAYLPAF